MTWRLFPDAETLALMADGRSTDVRSRRRSRSTVVYRRRARARSAGSPACCRCTASTCSAPGRTPTNRSWAGRHGRLASSACDVPHDGDRLGAGPRATCAGRSPASWRSRPASPSGPARTAAGGRCRRAAWPPQRGVPRRGVERRDRDRGAGARPRSASCTASPRRSPSSGSTSATRPCRRSGMEVVDTFYVRTGRASWSPTRSTAPRSSAPSCTPSHD